MRQYLMDLVDEMTVPEVNELIAYATEALNKKDPGFPEIILKGEKVNKEVFDKVIASLREKDFAGTDMFIYTEDGTIDLDDRYNQVHGFKTTVLEVVELSNTARAFQYLYTDFVAALNIGLDHTKDMPFLKSTLRERSPAV